ncbi:RidA family protein [Microbacterium sp. NPDC058389]|uniref:RidA family protein n=1 Tax=Microbacterium sp. NPDC058389 TaxID=3346475 RepID=UPI003651E590
MTNAVSTGNSPHGLVTIASAGSELVFLSGIAPSTDPTTKGLPSGFDAQLSLTFSNLNNALSEKNLTWGNVAKILLYLTDIRDLAAFTDALNTRFGEHWTPALTVAEVDWLPARGARLQLDVIAAH